MLPVSENAIYTISMHTVNMVIFEVAMVTSTVLHDNGKTIIDDIFPIETYTIYILKSLFVFQYILTLFFTAKTKTVHSTQYSQSSLKKHSFDDPEESYSLTL